MRKSLILFVMLGAMVVAMSCSEDRAVAPQQVTDAENDYGTTVDPELLAAEIVLKSGWDFDEEVEIPQKAGSGDTQAEAICHILHFERQPLVGDVVHYSYQLRVGCGPYDVIGLHRVVKERRPYRPIRTRKAIFLQHGDAVGFVKFLFGAATPSAPDDHAVAVYLAQNDVDVWGIDQNWVLVPEETTEFSFMADWGFNNQIANLRIGLAVSRLTRLFSGGGFGRMPLLGYSSGGWLGFAYLNDEAARPIWQRHVNGFVNADAYYKCGPDNEVGRVLNCGEVEFYTDLINNGEYSWWVGFADIGENALFDPDGDSLDFPGFTNLQVALWFGSATWRGYPLNTWWHYWGAYFDGDPSDDASMPTDTRFLPVEYALEFMTTASWWQANQFFVDMASIACDEEEVPWDDHLADITVPILNFGGAGGLAPSADYTLGLLGSTDIQHVIVSELPPEQKYEDWGHIDIFTATDAPLLAWQPLLEWIEGHPCREVPDTEQLAASP